MTLTHILPSLRRTIASPLRRDLWPNFTTTSTVDVTIAGVSLLRLVDWCGTPCVHTAPAPPAIARRRDSDMASVIVAKVLAVEPRAADPDGTHLGAGIGTLDVWIDADLSGCSAFPSETRMIGRASTAHDTVVRLRSESGDFSAPFELASDIHFGDLLAIPCSGTTSLHDIDPNHLHSTTTASDQDGQSTLLQSRGK
jgi:hypothetical protein